MSAALGEEERASFREQGFLVRRGVAPQALCEALLARARQDLESQVQPLEYEADLGYPGAPASRESPGGRTVRRLLQACARDAQLRAWATAETLAQPLRQLLGPEIWLSQAHHNCVMTKQPRFSSLTGWHQDSRYWNFSTPDLVSTWLALGEESVENGCLWFLPGTHRQEFAPERLDAALFLREDDPRNRDVLATRLAAPLAPGDVVLFHARTFHAAGPNRTGQTKFALVHTYHGANTHPLPGTRSACLPEIAL